MTALTALWVVAALAIAAIGVLAGVRWGEVRQTDRLIYQLQQENRETREVLAHVARGHYRGTLGQKPDEVTTFLRDMGFEEERVQ